MRFVTTCCVFCLSWQVVFAQNEKEQYEAWLDSMKNEHYIAREVQLDEVVITDSLQLKQINDPKMQMNMRSTDQMMHGLSGVHMVRKGNFANEPMLRGLTSERYILSIDGMRIFGACTDKMDPASSYIEPINLKSVDISMGSGTNMLGSSTGGGVNFNLKKPVFNREKPFRASVNTGYSSVSKGFDQSLDLNYSFDKLAVRLSGVHRKARNYTDGNGDEVRYSQYEKYNYAATINYRLKNTQLLSFDFVGDDAKDVGYPALPMDVSSAKAKLFGLTWLAPRLAFIREPEVKVYHNFINHVMDDTKRDTVAMHMDMPGKTRTTGGFVKGYLLDNPQSQLQVKADYYRSFWHAEMTMYPNDSRQQPMFMLTWPDVNRSALGVEGNYTRNLTSKLSIQSGMRFERTLSYISSNFGERQLSVFSKKGKKHRNELLMNGSVGLTWKPSQQAQSRIEVSYGERVPSASEQYGFYLFNRQDGYDYLGDPDLKKEKNLKLELSGHVKKEKLSVSASAFGYFFKDFIMGVHDSKLSAMTIGARGVKWYRNTERAKMFGGELSAVYAFSEQLSFKGDLKYVYGEDLNGKPLPQIPPLKLNFSFNQQLAGWVVQPEIEWSAAQRRISEVFRERETASYMLVNVRVSKDFRWNKAKLNLSGGVENLTNRAYREHFDFGNILRPGRNGYVRMAVKF